MFTSLSDLLSKDNGQNAKRIGASLGFGTKIKGYGLRPSELIPKIKIKIYALFFLN